MLLNDQHGSGNDLSAAGHTQSTYQDALDLTAKLAAASIAQELLDT